MGDFGSKADSRATAISARSPLTKKSKKTHDDFRSPQGTQFHILKKTALISRAVRNRTDRNEPEPPRKGPTTRQRPESPLESRATSFLCSFECTVHFFKLALRNTSMKRHLSRFLLFIDHLKPLTRMSWNRFQFQKHFGVHGQSLKPVIS